jgi:hypothetical protein
MNIDPDVSGQYEYPEQHPQQHGRFNFLPQAGPSNWRFVGSPRTAEPVIPVVTSTPSPPAEKKRSFVGGFFKGVKRLPKKMGYGGKGRRAMNGTEGDEGENGQGRGNTLPEYRSNPTSPAYGGAEYVPDIQTAFGGTSPIPNVVRSPGSDGTAIPLDRMAPPDRNLPPSLMAGGPPRRMPSLVISPPSDEVSHDSHHDSYQSHHESQYSHRSGYTQIHQAPQPQYAQVVQPDPAMSPNNAERTTVMVYSESAGTHSAMPMSDPGVQRAPSRVLRTSGGPPRQSTITIQTPIRLSEPPAAPPMGAQAPLSQVPASQDPQAVLAEDTVTSPATERLPPTADYRKMSNYPGSPWTRTTGSSWYDPSFASQALTPVERFFKTLYHLPWVSHGRVTIDYRPGVSLQGKNKSKGIFKKPKSSWYRRLSRAGRKSQELDLLSSGTMSIPDITQRTSLETSMMSSIPASPRSGRRRQTTGSDSRYDKSGGHTSGHRRHRHRHHHRRRRSLSAIEEPSRQSESPLLPGVYPLPYPAYPYTYPGYATMAPGMPGTPGILHAVPTTPPTTPGAGQQHIPVQVIAAPVPIPAAQHRSSSKPSPRGPRTRGGGSSSRRPTYPGGYTPYQAMAFPPPQLYFQGTPPTPTSAAMPTATPQQQQQPQFIQYVPVQVLPGAFNNDYYHATAGSIPSPPSSPTPRAGFTAPPTAP